MFSFRLPLPFTGESQPTSTLDLEPVMRERLSPSEFLSVLESKQDRVKSSNFVPPKLGDDHFGYFEVEYDEPVYK